MYYGINKYRDYAYEDYNKEMADKKAFEDCEMGDCEAQLSYYSDKNDRVNVLKTLASNRVKGELKCFEAESYAYKANKFDISYDEMKNEYGIDLFPHLESGCYNVVKYKFEECVVNKNFVCFQDNELLFSRVEKKRLNSLISSLLSAQYVIVENQKLRNEVSESSEEFGAKLKNYLCPKLKSEYKVSAFANARCKSWLR